MLWMAIQEDGEVSHNFFSMLLTAISLCFRDQSYM